MTDKSPLLSLLVVNIDYKLCQWRPPFPTLSESLVDVHDRRPTFVPLIRIFGSTDSGQRCCAHIHGVIIHFKHFQWITSMIIEANPFSLLLFRCFRMCTFGRRIFSTQLSTQLTKWKGMITVVHILWVYTIGWYVLRAVISLPLPSTLRFF